MRDMLSTCEEYRAETEAACRLRVTKIDSLDIQLCKDSICLRLSEAS
jgi:hypothetical protein